MIKLNWEKGGLVEIITSSDNLRNDERMNYIGNDSDCCTTPKVSATDDNDKGINLLNSLTSSFPVIIIMYQIKSMWLLVSIFNHFLCLRNF